jgi:hypothetical protein
MASKHSMIQVSGTTYRIRSELNRHQVFRLCDDREVGVFEHRPGLRVLASDIEREQLLEVARAALRAARLPWESAERAPRSSRSERRVTPKPRARASRTWASLLVMLWPSA